MEAFKRFSQNSQARNGHGINAESPASSDGTAAADDRNHLQEQEWKHRIHERLLEVVDLTLITTIEEKQARAELRGVTQRLMNEESVPLNALARQRIVMQIEDEVLGLGPLEPLLADPAVTDVLVNRFDSIYIERGGKLEKASANFRDNRHVLNIIDRIVSRVGRRIDESCPMVDARLQDGSRVNAIVPPLALEGPVLSIRRFPKDRRLQLPVRAMRAQISSAIHVVVQLERMEDGKRRMISIQEIQGMEGDIVTMSEIFRFQRMGVDKDGNVKGEYQATGLVPKFHEHLRQRGMELDLAMFKPGNPAFRRA